MILVHEIWCRRQHDSVLVRLQSPEANRMRSWALGTSMIFISVFSGSGWSMTVWSLSSEVRVLIVVVEHDELVVRLLRLVEVGHRPWPTVAQTPHYTSQRRSIQAIEFSTRCSLTCLTRLSLPRLASHKICISLYVCVFEGFRRRQVGHQLYGRQSGCKCVNGSPSRRPRSQSNTFT